MSNNNGIIQPVSPVRFAEELQGERGKRIRSFMQRRAIAGEFDSSRATILKLIDIGLDTVEAQISNTRTA